MNRSNAEKIFHHLHHCTNLMHRTPCGGNGRGSGHAHGRGGHRGQGRIIALLQERDGIGQRELAELLHIRPPSLSELLDKLESNGLIERRQSETDRRMSHVFLTETGRKSAAQFEAAREERMGILLSSLTESEQETLSQLLEKFVNGLQDQSSAVLGRGRGGRGRGNHEHGPRVCGHGHGGEGHHECQCGNPERRGRGPGSNHFGEEGAPHHGGGPGRGGRHGHGHGHDHHACGCGGHLNGHEHAHEHEHAHHGCCGGGRGHKHGR